MRTIASLAVIAGAATLGDYIWAAFGVRHTMTAGVVHGALLLTAVGGALGAAAGRPLKGLPIGALAGIGGAISYYLFVLLVDARTYGAAIPGAWIVMWLLLAALDGRWLRAPARRRWMEVASRGGAAAAASGLVFVFVRDVLWGTPPAEGRNYLVQFLVWACAWAPGLVALTWERGASRVPAGHAAKALEIAPAELWARIDRGDTLHILDVRSEGEFAAGRVPGAVNIPFTQVSSRSGDVPGASDEELILYCGHGPRAYIAAGALRRQGRTRIRYLAGHFSGWRRAGLAVERGNRPGL